MSNDGTFVVGELFFVAFEAKCSVVLIPAATRTGDIGSATVRGQVKGHTLCGTPGYWPPEVARTKDTYARHVHIVRH